MARNEFNYEFNFPPELYFVCSSGKLWNMLLVIQETLSETNKTNLKIRFQFASFS